MDSFRLMTTILLIMIALAGTAVALVRDPRRQVFIAGLYGLIQAILYFGLHSPDVALSQIVVSTLAVPALVLMTLARLERMQKP
jgi:uncharacterized MnhB-related membrane protein